MKTYTPHVQRIALESLNADDIFEDALRNDVGYASESVACCELK